MYGIMSLLYIQNVAGARRGIEADELELQTQIITLHSAPRQSVGLSAHSSTSRER